MRRYAYVIAHALLPVLACAYVYECTSIIRAAL